MAITESEFHQEALFLKGSKLPSYPTYESEH